MSAKIFVGNLNFNTTREALETLFVAAGQVSDVFIPVDRDTGRPRGFAFVEFTEDAGALAAIQQFDGFELEGRALRVNASDERPKRPSFSGGGGGGGGYSSGGGGGYGDRSSGGGGGGAGGGNKFGGGGNKPKGSRRNIRAKKRAL